MKNKQPVVLSWENYEKWWMQKRDGASISLFRVFFGIFMCMDALFFLSGIEVYFPSQEVYLKYPGFSWWPEFPILVHRIFLALLALAGISIALGKCVRMAALFALMVLIHFFMRDASFYLNHLVLVALLSFLFIFIPADQYFVWPRSAIPSIRTLPRYQLASFIGIFYLTYWASGLEKIRADWFSGDILAVNLVSGASASILARYFFTQTAVAWGVWLILALEIIAPIALSFKKTRAFMVVFLIIFHILNHFIFNIGLFSYLMIFGMILYFEPDWPHRFYKRGVFSRYFSSTTLKRL